MWLGVDPQDTRRQGPQQSVDSAPTNGHMSQTRKLSQSHRDAQGAALSHVACAQCCRYFFFGAFQLLLASLLLFLYS
jgi:hypothetical protein